jgi:hypothetical protein
MAALKAMWRKVSGKLDPKLSAELADAGDDRLLAPVHETALAALLARCGADAAIRGACRLLQSC